MKLQRLFDENFHLIPIRKDDKRPLTKHWNHIRLGVKETQNFLHEGYNLAVVAGEQSQKNGLNLAIADYDNRLGPTIAQSTLNIYRQFGTLLCFTPHGFHVYYRTNNPRELSRRLDVHRRLDVRLRYATRDTVRYTGMYALLPPSKVNGKSYWWLDNGQQEIATFPSPETKSRDIVEVTY